jgi:hypothetical protein
MEEFFEHRMSATNVGCPLRPLRGFWWLAVGCPGLASGIALGPERAA